MRFIPAVSLVRIQLQPPSGPMVKRLRHRPFTAVTRVRFPFGSPSRLVVAIAAAEYGRIAQLVRAPASHAGGQRFESVYAHHSKAHTGYCSRCGLSFCFHKWQTINPPRTSKRSGRISVYRSVVTATVVAAAEATLTRGRARGSLTRSSRFGSQSLYLDQRIAAR